MENKGRVRNILVSDYESFKEALIRSLIRNNINYLQIDNEFHFLDRIYRFYDIGQAMELIDKGILIFGSEDEKIRVLSDINIIMARSSDDVKSILADFEPVKEVDSSHYEFKKSKGIPQYNKQKVKRDNHMLNQKLKNNKR